MNYFEYAMTALREQTEAAGLGWDPDVLNLYTLLLLVKGTGVTLEDVHNAWAAWRTMTRPDHPDLLPFADLSPEVAALDEPYASTIRLTARRLAQGSTAVQTPE